jgi:hypothetical protein
MSSPTERLGDEVVSSGVQRLDDVGVVVPCGHHDHRDVAHRPHHGQHLQAINVGQSQVEQHHIGTIIDDGLQALQAAGLPLNGMAPVSQGTTEGRADSRVVLYEQDHSHTPDRNAFGGGIGNVRPLGRVWITHGDAVGAWWE